MSVLINIENLSKKFGKKSVLNGLNITINQGEKVAILGPNGSGKTTLINIILGFTSYDKGKLEFPFHKKQKIFIKNVGVQFQEGKFPHNYTINDVIDIIFEINYNVKIKDFSNWKKTIRDPEKEKILRLFGLENKTKYKIKNLSGGEKQRLNVLVSIISNPKILILDEISTGLDIKAQKELLFYINDFVEKNNITLIIISHLIHEIEILANKIFMLDEGKIQFSKDIKNFKNNQLTIFLNKYFFKDIKKNNYVNTD